MSSLKTAMGCGVIHTSDLENYKIKTPRLLLIFVLVLASVAACTTPHQELLQRDRQECVQFGFQPGTDRYSDCLLKLDAGRHVSHHSQY